MIKLHSCHSVAQPVAFNIHKITISGKSFVCAQQIVTKNCTDHIQS